ncbi:hypothetical protein C7S18_02950 [Ahniella affigens]|uniref:Transposase IS200-like domain-containing protein n=2 Tax=Ahniella affigens TaxID=2021234 RepID=A0A2P1PMY5_9GAMM|nr:hypothetical protein C7S18_02950 [Ahniella affigens]
MRYIDGVRRLYWRRFNDRLWQPNYYERVVRDDTELRDIREYVANNPLQWSLDRDHPAIAGLTGLEH